MADLSELGASALLKKIDSGQLSATEYAEDLIERVDRNTHLNAIASFDAEHLLSQSRIADLKLEKGQSGRLCGLPLIVKDNINTCLLYTSPSPRDGLLSRMPSSA